MHGECIMSNRKGNRRKITENSKGRKKWDKGDQKNGEVLEKEGVSRAREKVTKET